MQKLIVIPNILQDQKKIVKTGFAAHSIQFFYDKIAPEMGLDIHIPVVAFIDSQPVLRKDWDRRVTGMSNLVFINLPSGGGGGDKNPLATVAMLAVMVTAPYLAGAALAGTSLAGSALATTALGAVFSLSGGLLVGQIFPTASPKLPEFGNAPAPSPTYSIQARGNQARLGGAIPVLYGRHKIYPDLAAAPWSSYQNNEQYLHQLHMIGHGEYDLESIMIDDTPITSFAEVQTQIIPPNGSITLFDPDYVTAPEISGQQLLHNNAIGGFVVNPPKTMTTEIQVDIVAPAGLYIAKTDGSLGSQSVQWKVEAQKIKDDGTAIGGWFAVGTETLTKSTNTAQRLTYIYSVTSGRYQVRVTRLTADSTNTRVSDKIHWQAARAKLGRNTNTTGVTMLAIKMRATNNLSARSRGLISVIAQRKLSIWNGSTWTAPTATRSIAWAIADIARADYGGKLADKRIDLDALKRLDTTLHGRDDYFDAVFDTNITVWEALNRVAKTGRSGCYFHGGILRSVRDEAKSLPSAMFTPRNIIKNSLKIDYRLSDEDTATAIKIQYHNGVSWTNDTVTVSLDGDTSNSATVTLFGVTSENQARREGLYMARANRHRRSAIKFTTEMDGFTLTYGDLIRVVHQYPNFGFGGEIVEFDSINKIATLSEVPNWAGGSTGFLCLRSRNGSIQDTYMVTKGSIDDQVIFASGDNPNIDVNVDRENTFYAFATSATDVGIDAIVTAITPRGLHKVEVSAISESPIVHDE